MKYLLLLLMPALAFGQAFSFHDLPFMQPRGGGITLLNGLVAAWGFDNAQTYPSTFADSVNGILIGTNGTTQVHGVRGIMGGALYIENAGNRFVNTLTHDARFDLGTGQSFTFCTWLLGHNASNSQLYYGDPANSTLYDWQFNASSFGFTDTGGTAHSTGTGGFPQIPQTTYHMVILSFDASTHVMSYSIDNAVALTCGPFGGLDIKNTGTYKLVINFINSGCDEFYYWNRVLTAGEQTQLYNSGYGLKYPFISTGSVAYNQVISWGWSVTNRGATVSVTESNAVRNLVDGLNTDGVWSKVTVAVPFTTNTLASALTTLKTIWGSDGGGPVDSGYAFYSGNNGFVDGDLTVNGLTGNGSNKRINTSINPSTDVTLSSCSIVIYFYQTNTTVGAFDWGCFQNPQHYSAGGNLTTVGALGLVADVGVTVLAGLPGNGYMAFSQSAANRGDLYFANSVNAHASIANSTATPAITLPNRQAQLFAWNNGGSIGNYANSTVSFFLLGSGFSSANSLSTYTRAQTFRTTLGGGFR